MKDGTIRLGLIGAGRIGRLHAENLRHRLPGAELVAVCDVNEAAAQDCAARCGIASWGGDHRPVVARPDIDAVVVCSSTDTHTRVIEDAAAAGKHVFCEKPIDPDLGRIDRAVGAMRRAGRILQVGFNRRFDANFARIRQAVVAGEIGTPHQVHIISRDPGPPPIEYVRRSGGIFMDMTIHDFDMAHFLMADAVTEVFATGGVRVDPAIGEAGDLDTATIVLRFAGGAVAVIENCRQAVYGYDQRVEVFGSGGCIRAENNHPNNVSVATKESVRRDLPLHFFLERYAGSYIEEIRAFLEAIRTGGASPVSGEDGRVPVVIAMAAKRSVELNRPVRLAEVDGGSAPAATR